MLQFKNSTPFQGMMLAQPDPEGVECMFAIVRGTFVLGERITIAEQQVPVRLEPEYTGEPALSGIRTPSDIGQMKPGTDVLLLGQAYPPPGRPSVSMEVTLAAGPVRKTVRVFGDRVWRAGAVGASISSPAPFEAMPLVWERAFGGTDSTDGVLEAENRNPVGVGFRARGGRRQIDGVRLPNLEDARQPIRSPDDGPPPANFGPICPHWEPRRSYAGTYDGAWEKQRAPYLPADFDARFFQLAPPDQVAAGYLKGGEPVEVLGATPSGRLYFQLPEFRLRTAFRTDRANNVRAAVLDTVLIEPDRARLTLVWRSCFRSDKQTLRVREVEAGVAR